MVVDPLLDLFRSQLARRLGDGALAVQPLRLDRVEPRRLDRQVAHPDLAPAIGLSHGALTCNLTQGEGVGRAQAGLHRGLLGIGKRTNEEGWLHPCRVANSPSSHRMPCEFTLGSPRGAEAGLNPPA